MGENGAELKVPFKYARMWPREVFYRQLREAKPVACPLCWECDKSGEMVMCSKGHTVHQNCMNQHERGCKKDYDPPRTKWLYKTIALLTQPGVYVLYWDDVPYYVGQAKVLRGRLAAHARVPVSRYFNHWNYFSAFVVDEDELDRLEAILIAAMPTANGRKPLKREPFPPEVTRMVNDIHRAKANPSLAVAEEDTEEDES